jgi:hypothetical protein
MRWLHILLWAMPSAARQRERAIIRRRLGLDERESHGLARRPREVG